MKKLYALLLLTALVLSGCKMITKEIKKTNTIRKAAKEVCDCKYVGVSKNYDNGNSTMTLTIKKTNSDDFAAIADSIMANLKVKYEKVCNYGEVFILFETDSLTERYTYYGCEPGAEHDTFDPNELDELDEFEEWGEEEDSSVFEPV